MMHVHGRLEIELGQRGCKIQCQCFVLTAEDVRSHHIARIGHADEDTDGAAESQHCEVLTGADGGLDLVLLRYG